VKDGNGGPPLAARLLWTDSYAGIESGLSFEIGKNDLLIPSRGWKEGDQLQVRAVVALSAQKIDPLQASQDAEIKGEKRVLLGKNGSRITLKLDIMANSKAGIE
jgi:hypothetical protein